MANPNKRLVDLLVISDVHLGTHGSQARHLLRYLKTLQPTTVIVNGDLVDFWAFSKRYWPKSHMQIILYLLKWAEEGVKVYYLTGNHDEMMRKFVGYNLGDIEVLNEFVMDLDGKKAWFFHGDVFDVSMKGNKRMAKIGGWSYDLMVRFNRFVNKVLRTFRRGPVNISKALKDGVKKIVNKVSSFETTAAGVAAKRGYAYVVCGHVHKPEIIDIETDNGKITYLNSGDWIENLTALEWHQGEWRLFEYFKDEQFLGRPEMTDEDKEPRVYSNGRLFRQMEKEMGVIADMVD